MNVLHIATEKTWRGGENQLYLLCQGLKNHGIKNYLVAQPHSPALEKIAALAEVTPLSMIGGIDIFAAKKISNICQQCNIDIIDAHSAKAHSLGLLAKLFQPKLKLVVHRRVDNIPAKNIFNVLKYKNKNVSHYVAISHYIKQILIDWGIKDIPITTVKSAIDHHQFLNLNRAQARQKLCSELNIDHNTTIIVNVGALTEQKDHHTLLRTIKILKDQQLEFKCLVIGDGCLLNDLERLVAQLDIKDNIKLLGFRDDVSTILVASDILVHCPGNEGLGTVIQEASYAGNCIVATDVGGISEMIKHQYSGLLCPPHQPELLAQELKKVIVNMDLRLQYNQAAQQFIAQEFSVEKMVLGNLTVYEQLMH